jgi:DNA-binding winged helix-turn-helix (wHTH) protein
VETQSARYYRFVGFTLDTMERKVVDSAGNPVALTGLDFQLLKYFIEHPGVILDRSLLCEETRGRDAGPLDRSLDVQISRLRLRLNDDGKQPALIKTVRGAGYVFSADVSVSQCLKIFRPARASSCTSVWPASLLGRLTLVVVAGVAADSAGRQRDLDQPAARQVAGRGERRGAVHRAQRGRARSASSAACRRPTAA